MADLDQEDLKHLCQLCRINASDEELTEFMKDLPKVLNYMTMLAEVDTEGVDPCSHVLGEVENVFREDEPKVTLSRDDFLANSPSHVAGMVRVPPVIKKSS